MDSVRDNPTSWDWIAPFGNLRINACLRLPEAYRSLPRPSSPVDTKAFIMCSCSLTTNIRHGLGRPPYIRCQSIIVIPLLKPHRRLRGSAFQPCSLLPYVVVKELRLGRGTACTVGDVDKMVGVSGVEPETSSLSETRSNQLSYTPDTVGGLVELRGLEPLTLCLQSRCSSQLSYSPRVMDALSLRELRAPRALNSAMRERFDLASTGRGREAAP